MEEETDAALAALERSPMSEEDVIDGEAHEVGQDVVVRHQSTEVNLFGDASPTTVVEKATEAANALAGVIESKQLYSMIQNKKHVRVEGWTLLGSMLGVFPVVEWTRETTDGWEARVIARTRNGDEVGAAEAMCSRSEARWKKADDYAIRSMAQTRAVSKALRHPLGFIMTLAGYEATPESEVAEGGYEPQPTGGPQPLRLAQSWPEIAEQLSAYDEGARKIFFKFAESAFHLLFPTREKESLTAEEKTELFNTTAGAALALRNAVDAAKFPPPEEDEIRKAWASVLEGQELAIPKDEPKEEGKESS
jgi:hypothetical protein